MMAHHPLEAPSEGSLVFVEDHCANCLVPLDSNVLRLFCSDSCREVAETVRYERAVRRDGRWERADVREAVTIRRAHVLAGGYTRLGRKLEAEVRAAVIERDGGACRECGRPGTDIDHIDGSSPEMENLQLLCGDCHRAKSLGALVEADDDTRLLNMLLTVARVMPATPRLLADSDQWQAAERKLRPARRRRLREAAEAAEVEAAASEADAYYPTVSDFSSLARMVNRGYTRR